MKKLEGQSADHRSLDEANDDLDQWLAETQRKLDNVNPKAHNKQELDDTLADILVCITLNTK